jgi:hypothetical protein
MVLSLEAIGKREMLSGSVFHFQYVSQVQVVEDDPFRAVVVIHLSLVDAIQ